MEGQAPTRQEITKHLIAVGFEQKGVSYFRMGPIEVKLIDEDGIRFSVFNKETALDLCAFADISATYLFESSDE